MRKLLTIITFMATFTLCASAADHKKNEAACSKADNIIGKYYVEYDGECSKVRFYRCTDNSYQCKVYWVPQPLDKDGKPYLDKHNPDKSLRSVPMSEVRLIWNLRYDAEEKEWTGGTIYDPRTGIRASCTAEFVDDGKTIRIFGNVLGIGKSVYWKKINE